MNMPDHTKQGIVTIQLTKKECEEAMIQLCARLDHFDQELASCKDPDRIREIVKYTNILREAKDKLLTAR